MVRKSEKGSKQGEVKSQGKEMRRLQRRVRRKFNFGCETTLSKGAIIWVYFLLGLEKGDDLFYFKGFPFLFYFIHYGKF